MEQDVIEGNKLIAEFIGARLIKDDDLEMGYELPNGFPMYYKYFDVKALKFHSSWDWLMPVVEKIEDCKFLGLDKTYVQINDKSCSIYTYFDVKEFLRLTGDDKNEDGKFKVKISAATKIIATWLAVIDFIKWYNQLNK